MLFRRKRQQIYLYYIIFPEEKKDVFMIRWKKLFAALPLLLTACASPTEQAQTETVWAMDTACTITLHGGGVSETASLLCTLDETLDNYSTDSAVSRLNQSGTLSGEEDVSRLVQETAALQRTYGDSVDLTVGQLTRLWGITTDTPHVPTRAELAEVLPTISPEHVSVQADGTVTLTDGAQLDCGAVGKGYSLDRVKAALDESGTAAWGTVSMTSEKSRTGQRFRSRSVTRTETAHWGRCQLTVVSCPPPADTNGILLRMTARNTATSWTRKRECRRNPI